MVVHVILALVVWTLNGVLTHLNASLLNAVIYSSLFQSSIVMPFIIIIFYY